MRRHLTLLAALALAAGLAAVPACRLARAATYGKQTGSGSSSSGGSSGSGVPTVRVVSVANQSNTGAATIDGQVLITGDRVLETGQTDQTTDGIYVVSTTGAWARSADFSSAAQMVTGMLVSVYAGTTYGGTVWQFVTASAITVGTTALVFDVVPGGGALAGQTLTQARLTLRPKYFVQAVGNVQTLTLSGLNGNADGGYDLEIYVTCNHAGSTFVLEPNSATTNTAGVISDFLTGTSAFGAVGWPLYGTGSGAAGVTSPATLIAQGRMETLTGVGVARAITYTGTANLNGTFKAIMLLGQYTDTTTNLTTLEIVTSTSDGIGTGSYLKAVARGDL